MKLNSLIATSAIAVSVLAAPVAHAQNFTLYGGLDIGVSTTKLKTNTQSQIIVDVAPGFPQEEFILDERGSSDLGGFTYGLVGGIRFPTNFGYLGVEANIGNNEGGIKGRFFEGGELVSNMSIDRGMTFGATGMAGLNLNPGSSVYGLLGYQFASIKARTTDTINGATLSTSFEETYGGIRLGVGYESTLWHNASLRFELSQTFYSEETASQSQPFPNYDTERNLKYKPTETRAVVGVLLSF